MPSQHQSPQSPLIHLVDDDEAVRLGLSMLIGTVGLRVAGWPDAQSFLQGLDRQAIGAIVLDVRMPGMGGLALKSPHRLVNHHARIRKRQNMV